MGNLSTFKTVILGASALIGLVALLVFAGFIRLPGDKTGISYGNVELWGTIPEDNILGYINEFNNSHSDFRLNYTEKKSETFETELISALAAGTGPDLVFIPNEFIVKHGNKLYQLTEESISERTFRDTFVDAGNVFYMNQRALGLPVCVDPLVQYWNKDIFASAGVASVPRTWDELSGIVPKLTIKDERGNVTRSGVALGGIKNISNIQEVMSMLFLQAGDPIVSADADGGYECTLGTYAGKQTGVADALRYYADFSSPSKVSYTWNSAMANSRTAFDSGILAIYFGMASEYPDINKKNPHLNFDVAVVPEPQNAVQSGVGAVQATSGRVWAFAVLKNSKNINGALAALVALSAQEPVANVCSRVGLPPARRDLLSVNPTNAALAVFYKSVLLTKSWLIPSYAEVKQVFADMAESVVIGRSTPEEAVGTARDKIGALLKQQ